MEHTKNILAFRRKPIFDAVRILIGRSFTQAEVAMLDRAIDTAIHDCGMSGAARLGSLSERFESGGRGAGTVSGGVGDPGGVSYGVYQLSSRTGTAARFLAAEGAEWAAEFGGAAPGSAAFSRTWRAIAEREPDDFSRTQHAFIERTHYRPAVDSVRSETGVDLDARDRAVREVVWSVAVQHGRAARILIDAVKSVQVNAHRNDQVGNDRALIEAIYTRRCDYVLKVAERAGPAAARTLRSIVRNRYPAEREAALAMLDAPAG
jgi:ribosomal protein L22